MKVLLSFLSLMSLVLYMQLRTSPSEATEANPLTVTETERAEFLSNRVEELEHQIDELQRELDDLVPSAPVPVTVICKCDLRQRNPKGIIVGKPVRGKGSTEEEARDQALAQCEEASGSLYNCINKNEELAHRIDELAHQIDELKR